MEPAGYEGGGGDAVSVDGAATLGGAGSPCDESIGFYHPIMMEVKLLTKMRTVHLARGCRMEGSVCYLPYQYRTIRRGYSEGYRPYRRGTTLGDPRTLLHVGEPKSSGKDGQSSTGDVRECHVHSGLFLSVRGE